jgi:hypothetical protein
VSWLMCFGSAFLKSFFMKKVSILSLLAVVLTLSSCELAGGIFKAGFSLGIIVVIVVIVIIIFILAKVLGGRR